MNVCRLKSVMQKEEGTVKYYDINTADDNGRSSGIGNDDYSFPSIYCIPVRETDSKICTVSWESTAGSSLWDAGDLLSEKCQYFFWNARDSGGSRNCSSSYASFVEETDAVVHCRGDRLLYVACTVAVLKKFSGFSNTL